MTKEIGEIQKEDIVLKGVVVEGVVTENGRKHLDLKTVQLHQIFMSKVLSIDFLIKTSMVSRSK